MSLQFFPDLPTLTTALTRYMVLDSGTLRADVQEHLLDYAGHASPVDRIVKTAEILYAHRPLLDQAARDMTAQLAQFAGTNFAMGARGMAIAAAMQRDNGYDPPSGTTWPPAESDPLPDEQFIFSVTDEGED